MGTSVTPQATSAVPVREDVTLAEIEKGMAAAAAKEKQDADNAKAAAAAKASAEAAASVPDPRAKAYEEALRISEEGRKRLEEQLRNIAPAAPVRPAEAAPKELTTEELNDLFTKNPIEAIAYMQTKSLKTIEENISRRLDPLINGGRQSAEAMARSRYPDEFALFGDQINAMLNSGKIAPSAMNQPQAWDDLISYIRGQPANFDKLLEHRNGKQREKDAAAAQQREAASAGAHVRSESRAPAPVGGTELDATEREIARVLGAATGLDEEDSYKSYRQWKGVGR